MLEELGADGIFGLEVKVWFYASGIKPVVVTKFHQDVLQNQVIFCCFQSIQAIKISLIHSSGDTRPWTGLVHMGKYQVAHVCFLGNRKFAGSKAYIDCMTGFPCLFLII